MASLLEIATALQYLATHPTIFLDVEAVVPLVISEGLPEDWQGYVAQQMANQAWARRCLLFTRASRSDPWDYQEEIDCDA